MTEPIDRLSPVADDRRRSARRRSDPLPKAAAAEGRGGDAANLPVPTQPPPTTPKPGPPGADAAFAAQVIGQGGQKRGLRGGAPVLQQARSTYLETEWSGPKDRRPPSGAVTRTKV